LGKTVESYRLKLDKEVQRWSGFARALRKEDRKTFEQLMDICRNYASAGSNATRPVMFEAMVMGILVEQQKTLNRLKKESASTKSNSA
jgi:NADH:ubiquinone oxidoreductase subunit C